MFSALLLCAPAAAQIRQVKLFSYRTPSYLDFNQSDYTASESATNAVISLVRSGDYRESASVRFRTESGTATGGADYTSVDQVISFPPGVSFVSVNIPIRPDSTVEGPETVTLTLSDASPGSEIVRTTAKLTINDSTAAGDAEPRLTVSPGPSGTIQLSWPQTDTAFQLEKSTRPLSSEWLPVPTSPTLQAGRYQVTQSAVGTRYFYRLHRSAAE